VDALGNPVRVIITAGTTADCTQAEALIKEISPTYLLADRGYDTNSIIESSTNAGSIPVIPPKKNRITQRNYDRHLYRIRHLIENAFLKLKRWRGIATRYAKNTSSFLAAVQIRCIILWLL
jgi:transposase